MAIATEGQIKRVDRHGKSLYIRLETGRTWQIYLSSTGWLMPGNTIAEIRSDTDPIHKNFIHRINTQNIRVKIHFEDGQTWHYHDPRTWGKWYVRNTPTWTALTGPDWLKEPRAAEAAILDYSTPRLRTARDVLTDQKLTAGLGYYLASEVLWRAGIHPHRLWHTLSPTTKENLTREIRPLLGQCLERNDHNHWAVFDRAGEPCQKHPHTAIKYTKDKSGTRGAYFCPLCQTH